jgi:hypothetical protein
MNRAHCIVCGEHVQAADYKITRVRRGEDGKSITSREYMRGRGPKDEPVFVHHDGMKRDHPAVPHDLRSTHDDLLRQAHGREQAEAHVRSTLNAQMVGLSVDQVFRDRRR